MLEEIDDENIPAEYGGKCTKHLYESDEEVAIWGLAKKMNEAAGLPTTAEEQYALHGCRSCHLYAGSKTVLTGAVL